MGRTEKFFRAVNAPALLGLAAALVVTVMMPARLMPAPLPTTVAIEDMTWTEVRDALANGYTTVIVPTGGLEQNGPHMIIGKHDAIVRSAAERIAKRVTHTLVAPVVAYAPEGNYEPPSGHMRFPGTLGVPAPVFDGVLEGIARSLKAGGFKTICFIGDHGESQAVQKAVAARLSAEWAKNGVRVVQIASNYDDTAQIARLISEGHSRGEIGQHAGLIDTAELMSVNAKGVQPDRYRSMTFAIGADGVAGDPRGASADLGAKLLEMRVAAAAAEIKALLSTN
jgi:creatinine amidohydrolase/Fe(II)-dependent formamide hydrolase-like protein